MSPRAGLWVLAYDIADDARRRRVHALLKQYGDPVQESAFEARLTAVERKALLERAQRILDAQADRLTLYPVARDREDDIVSLGLPRPEVKRRTWWIV